jgi:hypothetical protein
MKREKDIIGLQRNARVSEREIDKHVRDRDRQTDTEREREEM